MLSIVGSQDFTRPAIANGRNDLHRGFMDRMMRPEVLRAVQRLRPIAEEAGLTLPQFALAWVLREPNVASAIIGASRPEQVKENAAASGLVIETELFVRAEAIIDEAMSGVEA